MKIVIQCAGSKNACGNLRTAEGKRVLFVANPDIAPLSQEYFYARPDDISDDARHSWRERLLAYIRSGQNPDNLLPAYRLYKNPVYQKLVERFGAETIYIASAGWGIIPADFLTPDYNITFNSSRDKKYSTRKKNDSYRDFAMLPDEGGDIIFLGGKAYLPLFCELTKNYRGRKIVFFNSDTVPQLSGGFVARRYETDVRTNWHYACAKDIVSGKVGL